MKGKWINFLLSNHLQTMAHSPLPDIRKLRTVLHSVLGGLYVMLVLSMLFFSGYRDSLEGTILMAVVLSGMWIFQWVVFTGEARPDVRSSVELVALLALAFGSMDAVLVCGWNMLAMKAFGWIGQQNEEDWMGFFLLVGFIFGVLLVAYTGWRLPRYEFLALMLVLHVVGGACQGAMLLVPVEYKAMVMDGYIHTTGFQILSAVSIIATGVALCWGIAPITYLIAYRGYRRRLQLIADEPAEAKID
jgi:hypothetical protein